MVKLLSRRCWAVLSAVALAFLVAAAYAASLGRSPALAECTKPLTGAEAELDVRIERKGGVQPQATTSMLVDLPTDNEIAWDLLRRTLDDDKRKQALRCILDMPDLAWYGQPPSVTKQGERVVVRAETSGQVSPTTGAIAQVGTLAIQTVGPQRWSATITAPDSLAMARWREVRVTAPPGWLSGSHPYLMLQDQAQLVRWDHPTPGVPGAAVERIRWERPALDPMSEASEISALAAFNIHPDVRAQTTSTLHTAPWNWVPSLLYSLTALILVGTLVLWAHRDKASLVRRMCLPVLALAAIATIYWLFFGYSWPPWEVCVAAASLLIVAMAAAWGVPLWASVLIGAQALIATVYSHERFERYGEADRLEAAVWTLLAFQLTMVLMVGMINAARAMLSKAQTPRPPAWVWWSGVACATVLVVEQFTTTRRLNVIPWADSLTVDRDIAAVAMMWFPWDLLRYLNGFVSVLAIIGVWALIRKRVEDGNPIEDRYVVLLFLIGPVSWDVWPFGLWLPVWLLALLVFWLWLRDRRTLLDTPLAEPGSTVRSVIESHSVEELRSAAAQWGRIRNRGRALDRELAKGDISLEEHTTETGKLLQIHPLPKASTETVGQLRSESVTPIDMILALGPGTTPWGNAKWGIKIAALVGMPAAALKLWLWWRAWPRPYSAFGNPAILDWVAVISGQAVMWLSAGAVLGLLWQRLRFRRGIGKALVLVTAYAAAELAVYVVEQTDGVHYALLDIALFTVVITLTALFMDLSALRTANTWWSRRRDALTAAYGMENLSTQVGFVMAQTVAILTIITTIHAGIVERPSDVGPRPPGGGQTVSPGR